MNQAPAPTHDTARAPTRSVTICRVVGIPIRVHWTFAFLVGLNRPGIPGGSIPWKRVWSHGEEGNIEAVSA